MENGHVAGTGELVNALRGDIDRAELAAVTGHLRSCDRCRVALVDQLATHASLAAAARLLRDSDRPDMARPAGGTGAGAEAQVPPELPRLPRRRRHPAMVLVAAAVVAVLAIGGAIGIGIGIATHRESRGGAPTTASRTVALAPVTGEATGKVTMTQHVAEPPTTSMKITTDGLAAAGPGRFYYAWLFDPATNKMLPLGVVNPEGPTVFQVSDDLLQRYQAVDISLQDDNGDPAHSATSVLRAGYS